MTISEASIKYSVECNSNYKYNIACVGHDKKQTIYVYLQKRPKYKLTLPKVYCGFKVTYKLINNIKPAYNI